MSIINPKQAMLELVASLAKALGNGHRLELLELLAQGERSVEALASTSGLPIANVSQHLQVLRRTGLVVSRKKGVQVLYSLSDDDVIALLSALRESATRHIADIDRLMQGYFWQKDDLEPMSRQDLLARMKDGLVTILDVRPSDEYIAGHIPGSVNIPLRDLQKQMNDLPQNLEIVAYCRGPYCVLAYEAVALLRQSGHNARRMQDGMPEWRAAGLPVKMSSEKTD